MSFQALTITLTSLLLINTACAETPNSAVAPKATTDTETAQETNELKALTFAGKVMRFNQTKGKFVPTKKACTMQMSVVEEDGGHHVVAQMVEAIHGQKSSAMELESYYLSIDEDKYLETQPSSGDFVPALVAVALDDEDEIVDVNKLLEYEEEGHLVQSLQFHFQSEANLSDMIEEMEAIVEAPNSQLTTKNLATLNNMEKSIIQIEHIGHIDAVNCGNFSLEDHTDMVTFNFKFEHSDDDHGDEDDHDHDHDDEDDDHDHEEEDDHEEEEDDHDHDHDHHGHDH